MSKKIKIGLIGFGMAGRVFHSPMLSSLENFSLIKIRETKKENIEIIKLKYPDAEIVKSNNDIFNDNNIDLVIAASTNETHFSIAKGALLNKKHVIVEKPFTVTSKEALELIEISKKQKKILTCYQNRRYDGDFKTIKKILDSKILGKLIEFESHFDRFRIVGNKNAWKEKNLPGSGMLYDIGSHLIDQALVLFGVPKEINGDLRTQRDGGEIIDNFDLTLNYKNLKVILKAGLLVKDPGPRFKLTGTKGTFTKYGLDIQEDELKIGLTPITKHNWGKESENMWGKIITESNGINILGKIETEPGDYRDYYQNVYSAILGKQELYVKPEESLTVIRIIEKAIESNKEKRTLKFEI